MSEALCTLTNHGSWWNKFVEDISYIYKHFKCGKLKNVGIFEIAVRKFG